MRTRPRTPLLSLLLATALVAAPAAFAQTSAPTAAPDPHHPQVAQMPQSPGSMPYRGGRGGMMGDDADEMMPMMRSMMGMRCGMMGDHIEGRLAFLKTELKITDAQMPQWNRFAEALRGASASMRGMRQGMMQGGAETTAPARLETYVSALSSRVDALRTVKTALDPLYAALSDEQKKQADEMMLGSMCMM